MSDETTKSSLESFIAVMNRWGTLTALGTDCDVRLVTVQQWKIRDNIPARFWARLVEAAHNRGFNDVTLSLLAKLADRKLPPRGLLEADREGESVGRDGHLDNENPHEPGSALSERWLAGWARGIKKRAKQLSQETS